MAVTPTPVFAQAPVVGIATLTSPTAITSRANITGTTGLTQLTPTSTNGRKIDSIKVKAKATSVATNVFIWVYDGTTSYLYDEIAVTAITATNTVDSFSLERGYLNLVLPATYQLYISVSISQDLTVFAHGGNY